MIQELKTFLKKKILSLINGNAFLTYTPIRVPNQGGITFEWNVEPREKLEIPAYKLALLSVQIRKILTKKMSIIWRI